MGYPINIAIGAPLGAVAAIWVSTVSQEIPTLVLRLLAVFLLTALLVPASIALPSVVVAAALSQTLALSYRCSWEAVVLAAVIVLFILFVFVEVCYHYPGPSCRAVRID